MKHASEGSTLALKPRGDVIRRGISGPTKRTPKFFLKKVRLHHCSQDFVCVNNVSNKHLFIFNWWLVRATYVVDGLFFGHFFWKVVGTVRIHGNT